MESNALMKTISDKINNSEPIKLAYKSLDEEDWMIINSILARALARNDQLYLLNSIITVLREIVINATKANLKRIFFIKNNLNINDEAQYEKGMLNFKKEMMGDSAGMKNDLKSSDYTVKIEFNFDPNRILVSVLNNSSLLPQELDRIRYRMEKARTCDEFYKIYDEIEDGTEGAGLGILLVMLLLKGMGLQPENLTIQGTKSGTLSQLSVPLQNRPVEITTKLKLQILREISGIPTFPEQVMQIQRACRDPNVSIDKVADMIKADPALSADVIKLSNSAGISPGRRIEDIKTALVTIGMKNINALLMTVSARSILKERYDSFEQVWDHSYKVAFYAREIARAAQKNTIAEKVYMAGLLHDLGKIILLSTDRKLVGKIADIVRDRKITTSTLEEISIGLSHSTIGAMISQVWSFPDFLVEGIRHHHSPLSCKKEYSDIVNSIYLADILAGIEDGKYSYYSIEYLILEQFDLLDLDKFNAFHDRLKNKYALLTGVEKSPAEK